MGHAPSSASPCAISRRLVGQAAQQGAAAVDAKGLNLHLGMMVGECSSQSERRRSAAMAAALKVDHSRSGYIAFLCPALDTGKQYKQRWTQENNMMAALKIDDHSSPGKVSAAAVLADGKRAARHWASLVPIENCAWTGGTFLIGLIEYYKATLALQAVCAVDEEALAYTKRWAEHWGWKICVGWQQESGCMPLAKDTAYVVGKMWSVSSVNDVADCCALADSQQRSGCWAYTYYSSNKTCTLHTNDNVTQRVPGAQAGWVRQGYGFPPPPSPPFTGKPKPEGSLNNPHNANEQLCGAVYAELHMLDGTNNQTQLADTKRVLGEEIADTTGASTELWSWVDALHMGMSTYARIGNVTGDHHYYEQQWKMFNFTALSGCPGNRSCSRQSKSSCSGYCLWNESDSLFYRDDNYAQSTVYWARGDGWAFAALVSAIEYGYHDPHRHEYERIFAKLAGRLGELQSPDGAWRPSLLNASGFPVPETTGTANFAYGLAYGINSGLLSASRYRAVVEKAWHWLSQVALRPDGTVNFCQPGGSHPVTMLNRWRGSEACWSNGVCANTSNFCTGQFLLAAAQVARLVAADDGVNALDHT
eukprot:SAG31_NODE_2089_length_6472_cov_4.907893_4_plen_590_part_00